MDPAERQGDVLSHISRPLLVGDGLIGLIAVAMDDAPIAFKQLEPVDSAAAGRVGVDHPGRLRPQPRSVIAGDRPEVASLCLAPPRIQDIHADLGGGDEPFPQASPQWP